MTSEKPFYTDLWERAVDVSLAANDLRAALIRVAERVDGYQHGDITTEIVELANRLRAAEQAADALSTLAEDEGVRTGEW